MALGRRGGKVISRAHPRPSLGDTLGISHVQIPRRYRIKAPKDTLLGITVHDIRRIARRGGVKRIQVDIYNETRNVLRQYLAEILKECCFLMELKRRRTVTVYDVVYALKRKGTPLWGFDKVPNTFSRK